MFRLMRRKDKQIPDEAAKRLLATEKRAVFAVNGDDGYPFAIPVNFVYDETAGKIFFHGAKSGHKVDSLRKDDRCCFTVYGNETRVEGEWAPYLESVVVFGRCALEQDPAETERRVRELALKYYPSAEEAEAELRRDLKGVQLYAVTIEHLTGKRIQER